MTQENITLRNDAFDLIIIVYMGDAQRLEKFNNTFKKTMHWGMMDGGFIIFCFLNYRVSFKKSKKPERKQLGKPHVSYSPYI
jgi:hypothetical protein